MNSGSGVLKFLNYVLLTELHSVSYLVGLVQLV
jgi:hypothetical protein